MKPKVFIGSSSEQIEVAESIAEKLSSVAEIVFWQNVFKAGRTYIDDLVKTTNNCDFAVFVFNPDDITKSRDKDFVSVRDNVLFEFGLFIGRIGYERTIAVSDENLNPKIMSDYQGVTYLTYDGSIPDLNNSTYGVYVKLKKIIIELGIIERPKLAYQKKDDINVSLVGIDKVYTNYDEAESEILYDLKNSPGPIRLFLQIAAQNIGEKGSLYDIIEELSSKQKEIRILHTDEHSPMFSKDRLLSLGKKPELIIDSIKYVNDSLRRLEEKEGSSIRQRIHQLSFIWRIYAFDNRLYLMPYFSDKDATKKSPVIRFKKSENSMYNTYIEWFDNLWERAAPQAIRLDNLITPATPTGTALFLKWNGFNVFGITQRDLADNKHLRFYGIGGKKHNAEESWEDCALREGAEETTGAVGKLISASHTDFYRANGVINSISIIESEITPRLILEKRKHSGYGSMLKNDDHYYLVAYDAELTKKPFPSKELAAIILLTDSHLKYIRNGIQVRLSEIEEQGGEVICHEDCIIDRNKFLMPHGTAIYLLRVL